MSSLYLLKMVIFPLIAYSADRIILHPLENILSHVQKRGGNAIKTTQTLYKEGSLYFGFIKPFLTFGPAKISMLGFYYFSLNVLNNWGVSFVISCLIAGIGAGIIDATLTCPGEVHRTRTLFGTQKPVNLKQFYTGYLSLLARSLTGAPIILAGASLLIHYECLPKPICNGYWAGFIMGFLSQFITSPIDMIKNEMMSKQETNYREVISKVLQERSAYRGLLTKIIRVSLGSAVIIGCIDSLNGLFDIKE